MTIQRTITMSAILGLALLASAASAKNFERLSPAERPEQRSEEAWRGIRVPLPRQADDPAWRKLLRDRPEAVGLPAGVTPRPEAL